jgi:uncharacterized protein YbjT (DUF2867 family)
MKIVINTPSGKVGRIAAERLLLEKQELVIISRNPEKVSDLVKRGAILVEGSFDDPEVLTKALDGADGLFWVTPPNYSNPDYLNWVLATAQIAAGIASKKGVKNVVVLSSAGAQSGKGSGPIGALLAVETAFENAVPNVTILRPGFYMENFLNYVYTISTFNSIFSCNIADIKIPMVATSDIGNKAADIILKNEFNGTKFVGVHGPEDINFIEAALLIGKGIGENVNYVEITPVQACQNMIEAGFSLNIANLLTEMNTAIQSGKIHAAEPRSPETTTPTTLLEFSKRVLKPAIANLRSSEKEAAQYM